MATGERWTLRASILAFGMALAGLFIGAGSIRHANQGVFEILPRDQVSGISEESQIAKIVRVVSTVEYSLR